MTSQESSPSVGWHLPVLAASTGLAAAASIEITSAEGLTLTQAVKTALEKHRPPRRGVSCAAAASGVEQARAGFSPGGLLEGVIQSDNPCTPSAPC